MMEERFGFVYCFLRQNRLHGKTSERATDGDEGLHVMIGPSAVDSATTAPMRLLHTTHCTLYIPYSNLFITLYSTEKNMITPSLTCVVCAWVYLTPMSCHQTIASWPFDANYCCYPT